MYRRYAVCQACQLVPSRKVETQTNRLGPRRRFSHGLTGLSVMAEACYAPALSPGVLHDCRP